MQELNKCNVEALIKAGFERHQNEELDEAELSTDEEAKNDEE